MKTDSDSDAFLEYIGKRLSENPRASHSGKHRAAFTALQSLIEAALAQGYTMRATWFALREKKQLSMSYETFRAHCRRAALGQPQPSAAPPSRPRERCGRSWSRRRAATRLPPRPRSPQGRHLWLTRSMLLGAFASAPGGQGHSGAADG